MRAPKARTKSVGARNGMNDGQSASLLSAPPNSSTAIIRRSTPRPGRPRPGRRARLTPRGGSTSSCGTRSATTLTSTTPIPRPSGQASVLAAGRGYCVGKASLYCRALPRRRHSGPARARRCEEPSCDAEAPGGGRDRRLRLPRLYRAVPRRRLGQGDADLQRYAVREARGRAARFRRALGRAAAGPSTARAGAS